MRDGHGFETADDDDLGGALIEDDAAPETIVFDIGLSDAGSATEFAREAAALGYDVEMRAPDDGEAFYEVTCSRTMPAGPADVDRARHEIEALAEKLGCLAIDADEESDEGDPPRVS